MKKFSAILAGILCTFCNAHAQSDSLGIFSVRGSEIKRVEISKPTATKITNAVVTAKSKLVFDGTTSETRFDSVAVFRIYYGTPSPLDAVKYYMFTTAYTPNDLKVAQLTLKKGKRLLTSSTISLTGGNIGAKGAKGIKTETKKLSDNVYEITIKGPTGEYCILPIIGGMAIGNGGVFAFTLN